jgi:aryl-alcohol dehydrogenase-like predicted oxidoreductase
MNLNKLVIGGAQLGMAYGNRKIKMNKKEILNFLKFSLKNKIKFVDIAQSYGNIESIIGKLFIRKKLRIITKISNYNKINFSDIQNSIKSSLNRLKIKKINYLMFHDFKVYKKIKAKDMNKLRKIKNIYYTKLGVSVYTPEEFLVCCKDKNIDFVQIPFNIIDYRWKNINFLNIKKKYHVQIHVRSIFLKGSLLKNFKKIPINKIDKNKIKIIFKTILKKNQSMLDLCLNFILTKKWVDKVIIGFNSINQLKKILKLNYYKVKIDQTKFCFLPKKALMPKYWN